MVTSQNSKKGFTLIELIIVITILVILGVVVVVLIDPAEILAQSRDSQRISDLASMKGAIQIVMSNGVPSNAGTVCYSTNPPETTSNPDANIYVSSPSAGTSAYVTTAAAARQLADGTGWVKIDFTGLATGNALSNLPVDPINDYDTAGLYYRWGCNYNGSIYQYELDATLESAKWQPGCSVSNCEDKGANDGGNSNAGTPLGGRYEIGNNLNVLPVAALGA